MHASLRRLLTQIQRYTLLPAWLGTLTLCLILSGCSYAEPFQAFSQPAKVTPISSSLKQQGAQELQAFQHALTQLKNANKPTTSYQQQYNHDLQALQHASTGRAYQAALKTITSDTKNIELLASKAEASTLQQHLQADVAHWENSHLYQDAYNNTTYKLGFEYDNQTGIGTWIQDDLSDATSVADYQQIIADTNMYQTNFNAMTSNASDTTPYDQVHQSDLKLINNYQETQNEVLVVSLSEQSMRVYDHSKLIKAFLVTTGQPNKPTPPGSWWVESHQKNIIFKSSDPKSSPYWYPDTPIHYAMQYHSNGYFIHDSWWRAEYGPNTQFPHQDTTGDISSDVGSHGCINMSLTDAQWVYNYVRLYTDVIVY
jgi:lipoprotein-anchoring transpeptidase ErfK/SrfK